MTHLGTIEATVAIETLAVRERIEQAWEEIDRLLNSDDCDIVLCKTHKEAMDKFRELTGSEL